MRQTGRVPRHETDHQHMSRMEGINTHQFDQTSRVAGLESTKKTDVQFDDASLNEMKAKAEKLANFFKGAFSREWLPWITVLWGCRALGC